MGNSIVGTTHKVVIPTIAVYLQLNPSYPKQLLETDRQNRPIKPNYLASTSAM